MTHAFKGAEEENRNGIFITFGAEKRRLPMESTRDSRRTDWIIFVVSTVVMIALLIFANEWFWLALPFSASYLAKALDVL